ncbi:hypothetical protein NDU88_000287 [Pleurodeles waltl]|uniref:Uncharacterized protein n=1 Tax=Pleurodeles waltl TaxID=8319 RepID=A0AAV7P7V4_PLEWA|nr:hypothetical protein NDU88_000287 [Pleurodeles waltl]
MGTPFYTVSADGTREQEDPPAAPHPSAAPVHRVRALREEDNFVLPRPRDPSLTSRARESELETLGVREDGWRL